MADLKVRGIPWMTKLTSWYQFSDGLYPGWHPGQRVLTTQSRNTSSSSGYYTIEGEKWWGDRSSNMGAWNVQDLFSTTGVSTRLSNGTRHNTLHFVGGFTNNTSWVNDSVYYFTSRSAIDDYFASDLWTGFEGDSNTNVFKKDIYGVAPISVISNGVPVL